MKKAMIILVLALGAAYFAASVVAGVFITGEVDRYREELAVREDIEVRRLEYEPGYLGGKLYYDLRYNLVGTPLAGDALLDVLVIEGIADVRHGPYVGGSEGFALALTKTRWALPEALRDFLPEYPVGEPLIEVATTMGFDRVIRSVFVGKDYDGIVRGEPVDSRRQALLLLENWGGTLDVTDLLDHFDMTLHMGGLSITIEDAGMSHGFSLSDVLIKMDSTRKTRVLWTGEAALILGRIEIRENGRGLVVNDVEAGVKNVFRDDVFDNILSMQTGKIDFDGISLNGLTFGASLNDVDVRAYETLMDLFAGDILATDAEMGDRHLEAGKAALARLFSAGPSVNIDALSLHVIEPEDVSGYLQLYYPSSSPVSLDNPYAMIRHIGLKGGASASAKALEQLTRIYAELESRKHEKKYGSRLSDEAVDDNARRSFTRLIVAFYLMPYFTVSEQGVSSQLEIKDGSVFANGRMVMGAEAFFDMLF